MRNSFLSSKRPLKAVPTSLVAVVLAIAVLGFADAAYLTVEHYQNAIPPCTIGGCETVLTSAYSTVLGIPVSLVGSIYYLLVAAGLLAYLDGKRSQILKLALCLPILGFVASVGLVSVMAFVLHAYCPYCLGSATITTVLAIFSAVIFAKYRGADTLAQ